MGGHDGEKEVGASQAQSNRTSMAPSTPDEQQSKPEKKVDDWDGPEDADNPQNWARSKKIWHTAIPSIIAFICTLGSSIITPGRDSIMQDLGVSAEVALLPYVLYVAGLAFGPMIAAPCSETFGRRAVYLTGMPLFAVFNLGAGFSNNIAKASRVLRHNPNPEKNEAILSQGSCLVKTHNINLASDIYSLGSNAKYLLCLEPRESKVCTNRQCCRKRRRDNNSDEVEGPHDDQMPGELQANKVNKRGYKPNRSDYCHDAYISK